MPKRIERPVTRGLQQITANGVRELQRLTTAPELQHHILRDLFRHAALPQHRFGDAHEECVIRAKDRVERTGLTGAQAGEQLTVVYGGSRHKGGVIPEP